MRVAPRVFRRRVSTSVGVPGAALFVCVGRAPLSSSNFARNSPVACSNIELTSLELQRFRSVSKSDRGKLCATFAEVVIAVTLGSLYRPRAPQPGPATTHEHCSQVPLSSRNFARNSPAACSNIEFVSLELQRFRSVSKSDRGKLCAKFVWSVCCCRHPRVPRSPFGTAAGSRYPRAPRPGPPVPSALVGRVVLSWVAATLPRIRYKILPARCCANQSGTKLSLHVEKAPN